MLVRRKSYPGAHQRTRPNLGLEGRASACSIPTPLRTRASCQVRSRWWILPPAPATSPPSCNKWRLRETQLLPSWKPQGLCLFLQSETFTFIARSTLSTTTEKLSNSNRRKKEVEKAICRWGVTIGQLCCVKSISLLCPGVLLLLVFRQLTKTHDVLKKTKENLENQCEPNSAAMPLKDKKWSRQQIEMQLAHYFFLHSYPPIVW